MSDDAERSERALRERLGALAAHIPWDGPLAERGRSIARWMRFAREAGARAREACATTPVNIAELGHDTDRESAVRGLARHVKTAIVDEALERMRTGQPPTLEPNAWRAEHDHAIKALEHACEPAAALALASGSARRAIKALEQVARALPERGDALKSEPRTNARTARALAREGAITAMRHAPTWAIGPALRQATSARTPTRSAKALAEGRWREGAALCAGVVADEQALKTALAHWPLLAAAPPITAALAWHATFGRAIDDEDVWATAFIEGGGDVRYSAPMSDAALAEMIAGAAPGLRARIAQHIGEAAAENLDTAFGSGWPEHLEEGAADLLDRATAAWPQCGPDNEGLIESDAFPAWEFSFGATPHAVCACAPLDHGKRAANDTENLAHHVRVTVSEWRTGAVYIEDGAAIDTFRSGTRTPSNDALGAQAARALSAALNGDP